MKNKSIGIVLADTPGYSETFFRSKVSGLQEHGFNVTLFCANDTSEFSLCTVKRINKSFSNLTLPFKMVITFFSLVTKLSRILKFLKLESVNGRPLLKSIKIVYLNAEIFSANLDWLYFGFGALVIDKENIAKSINAKMAVSFRGFDIGVFPLKNPNCYNLLWKKVDKIHVISDDIKSLLYSNNFKNEAEIIKITPAIDINYFKRTTNVKNDKLQILTIARLHWKKGLDYTLKALYLLKTLGTDFHYTLIGAGSELEYLKYLAHDLNLENNISFKGKLSSKEVKKELTKANLYVQYSVQEGFCNAALEAQAMELLCVVSNAEGLSENILNNKTGWVVPMRRPQILANKIQEIINLPEAKIELVKRNARQHILDNFKVSEQKKSFVRFYDDI